MIELTIPQLVGLCVVLLLTGGSIAVYGIRFLEWTDRRRADRRLSGVDVDIPEQRAAAPSVRDFDPSKPSWLSAAERERRDDLHRLAQNYTQRRADAIRDEHLARRETSRRLGDPPPPGMEDRIVERLTELGEDLRAADPQLSNSSTPTDEENTDGR